MWEGGILEPMYILLILLSITTAFACRNDQLSVRRSTGIGAGSNGNSSGSANQKVNVPVLFNGKWGCWEQEGGLSFDVKEKSRTMTVVIPKSKFEDLPGRTTSYATLQKNIDGSLWMDIATFVCLGSHVISAETFSGGVANARALQNMDVQVSTVFATGVAAGNLNRQRAELARRLGRKTELPGDLEEYFDQHYSGEWSHLEKYELFVPSIYLSASMNTPLSNLSASYNTIVLTKSACSPEFEQVMAPLRFEKLKFPEGLKTKVKKGNLQISW